MNSDISGRRYPRRHMYYSVVLHVKSQSLVARSMSIVTSGTELGDASCAVRIQRCWRGLVARRAWIDLLLNSMIAMLPSTTDGSLDSMADAWERPDRSCSSQSLSLEEARAMAQEAARETDGDLCSPSSCSRTASEAVPAGALLAGNSDGKGAAKADRHGAVSSDDPAASEAGRLECVLARDDGYRETSAGALQFTSEMAEGMSHRELRELMGVLTRLTVNRNNVLVDLLQKRDELLQERECREQLVQQLLAQMDNSRALRDGSRSRRGVSSSAASMVRGRRGGGQ